MYEAKLYFNIRALTHLKIRWMIDVCRINRIVLIFGYLICAPIAPAQNNSISNKTCNQKSNLNARGECLPKSSRSKAPKIKKPPKKMNAPPASNGLPTKTEDRF